MVRNAVTVTYASEVPASIVIDAGWDVGAPAFPSALLDQELPSRLDAGLALVGDDVGGGIGLGPGLGQERARAYDIDGGPDVGHHLAGVDRGETSRDD